MRAMTVDEIETEKVLVEDLDDSVAGRVMWDSARSMRLEILGYSEISVYKSKQYGVKTKSLGTLIFWPGESIELVIEEK